MKPPSDAGRPASMRLDEDQNRESMQSQSLDPILNQASVDRAAGELVPKKLSLVGAAHRILWLTRKTDQRCYRMED